MWPGDSICKNASSWTAVQPIENKAIKVQNGAQTANWVYMSRMQVKLKADFPRRQDWWTQHSCHHPSKKKTPSNGSVQSCSTQRCSRIPQEKIDFLPFAAFSFLCIQNNPHTHARIHEISKRVHIAPNSCVHAAASFTTFHSTSIFHHTSRLLPPRNHCKSLRTRFHTGP